MSSGQTPLLTRLRLAHYSSLSREVFSAQIRERPSEIDAMMAIRGQKALCSVHLELTWPRPITSTCWCLTAMNGRSSRGPCNSLREEPVRSSTRGRNAKEPFGRIATTQRLGRRTNISSQCLVYMDLLAIPSLDILQKSHRTWVEESLRVERSTRDSKWSESIAVGDKGFVARVKKLLGLRAKGRKIKGSPSECQLRETQSPYSTISAGESSPLSSQNLHFWEVYPFKPGG
jgi:hypothetical protein